MPVGWLLLTNASIGKCLTYTALGHLSGDGARGDWRAGLWERRNRGEGYGGEEVEKDGGVVHYGWILKSGNL